MLIRFAVGNFMSFKEMIEFNMTAGRISRHNSHVVLKNGKRILKSGFIFGANASGKTNLVRAIAFARDIILDGIDDVSCDKKYFRIDSKYKNLPGVFQFDILSGEHFYSYGFAISYINSAIEEEWLYQIDDDEKCIFLRTNSDNGKTKVSTQVVFDHNSKMPRFEVYKDSFENSNKMEQTLFLSDVVQRSPNDIEYQPFRDVMNWFNNLIVIFPDSKFGGLTKWMEDNNTKKQLSQLLRYFDTGIESIDSNEKEISKFFDNLSTSYVDKLKTSISKELTKEHPVALVQVAGVLLAASLRDGEIFASELVSDHGNKDDMFELKDESDGTKRLFDLIPVYQRAERGNVIVIDELDRSLHTKATMEFIRYFFDITDNCDAQIIATTHDSNILDLDFLRQDEIWFVERSKDHSSHLYSLNKFGARFDKKVEKEYLLGRYGAIPIFQHFKLMETEEGDDFGR